MINQIETIRSAHLVHFAQGADGLTVSVVAGTELPQAEVSDFPPSRIMPLIADRLPLDMPLPSQTLLNSLEARLAAQPVDLGETYPEPGIMQILPSGDLAYELEILELADDDNGTFTVVERHIQVVGPQNYFYYAVQRPIGYLIVGQSAAGEALAYVNLTSSQINNDTYRYYEFLFRVGTAGAATAPRLRLEFVGDNSFVYDVAGIEGFTFPVILPIVFLIVLASWVVVLLVVRFVRWYRREDSITT
ncbi:MAG: hypothetical protein GYB67_07330 [Chloroflexi bacterium]|nr:hypothetical protein [Chloroflexota bacterium]